MNVTDGERQLLLRPFQNGDETEMAELIAAALQDVSDIIRKRDIN